MKTKPKKPKTATSSRQTAGSKTSSVQGAFSEIGSPGNRLVLKSNTYQWGDDRGTFSAAKTDDYTCILDFASNNPDFEGIPNKWSLTREKNIFILKHVPDEIDETREEIRFKPAGNFDTSWLADSKSKPSARTSKIPSPAQIHPVSDFISFILDWGHPEWIVLAVEAPIKRVSALYASIASAKRTWPNVPVRASKKNDDMAPLVAVVQPQDSNWSIIYRIMCYPIGSSDIDEAMKMAQTFSTKLKTRALAFAGEDTSGAMQYWLYRNGKQTQVKAWESQDDPADDAFQKLDLVVPVCYPRRDGKTTYLAAPEPWTGHIQQADIIDIGGI